MDRSKGRPAQPQGEGRGAAARLGEGNIHLPTELWQPQDPLPPPPPAMCIHASLSGEGDADWDCGTKGLAGKRKLLFRWLAVAPTSPNLGCSLAANCWEGRRIAVEEMLDMKESCILEKAMAFPHPSSYLQFQTIYAYFSHVSHIWFLTPLYLIWELLTLCCLCTAQVALQEKGGLRLCFLSSTEIGEGVHQATAAVAAIILLCSGLKYTQQRWNDQST